MENFWENWKGFWVAFSYGIISIAITFFNKAVFDTYGFQASNTLTVAQMSCAILFLDVGKRMKWVDFPDLSIAHFNKLYVLGLAYFGMVVTGLSALRFINVPMFTALRRATTFIVIIGQYFYLKKTVSREEFFSVSLMIVGATIASWGDLGFDFFGYCMVALNCIVTAYYLVLISKKQTETGLNTFGLMWYNNIIALPIVFVVVIFSEWDQIIAYKGYWDIGFILCFAMSAILAFWLNVLVFLCSIINSPLTTSVTGQIKGIGSTALGFVLLGGVQSTPIMIFGIVLSTIASVYYGYVKYVEQMAKLAQKNTENKI